MAIDSSAPATKTAPEVSHVAPRAHSQPLLRLLSMSRFLIIIGVVSIIVAATALLIYGAFYTYQLVAQLISGTLAPPQTKKLMLASIEVTDMFLLATVLYIIAIGLYELFIDDRIPLLPVWLIISDIDQLKHKLISVVIAVLGVVFLGQVVAWDGERNLQPFGIATAAVVAALTYFLSSKSEKSKEPSGSEKR